MLIKILRELKYGKIKSKNELARKFSIDENFLDQMINQLIQMGYIELVKFKSCNNNCSCCASKGTCSSFNISSINMWSLTEKGKKVVVKRK